MGMVKGALEGLRVLESTVQIAGPYCGRLLGELGAEVIKVEPLSGEASRRSPPFYNGAPLLYLYSNANKKSIALNLKDERGQKVFTDLAEKSDILVVNYRPGVMERLGLGYEVLKKKNKGLIYVSITGFGYSGKHSSYAGYDMLAQAMSGLADANGDPSGVPKINSMTLDYSAAMMAATAALAAVINRERTGQGQFIDISLQDVGMVYVQHLIGQYLCGMRYRSGNRRLAFAPFSVYPTLDGYAVVAIDEDSRWEAFLKAIGKESATKDETLKNVELRVRNYDQVDKLVSEWAKGLKTEEVVRIVTSAGGASCPVKKVSEVIDDEHLKARQMLGTMNSPVYGDVPYVGSVFKMSETPGSIDSLGPQLGADTQAILTQVLGYSENKVATLRSEGVV
jgi:crotonobetainyl-CoA:carnitine CoA-transferase CaiB-like acyl-CoA transferase